MFYWTILSVKYGIDGKVNVLWNLRQNFDLRVKNRWNGQNLSVMWDWLKNLKY